MNIAIFGSGIISFDAVAALGKKKHHVTLATRHPESIHNFIRAAEKTIVLNEYDEASLAPILANNQLIIVAVLSEISKENAQISYDLTCALRSCASSSDFIRRILYISSTVVYGNHDGLWVDETSSLKTKTEEGMLLLKAEKTIDSLKNLSWPVCVLRIAELYGPEKEISKRIKPLQKAFPGSGLTYTNMVHRLDVTAAIDYCISHNLEGTYNLADDDHPTREELYQKIADRLRLPKIKWDPNYEGKKSINKRVSNRKIKASGFFFLHPQRVLD